jgi:heavy metal sensor kinase
MSFSIAMVSLFYKQNLSSVDEKLLLVKSYIEHEFIDELDDLNVEKEVKEFSIKNLYVSVYTYDKSFKLLKTNRNIDEVPKIKVILKGTNDIFTIKNDTTSYRVVRTHLNATKKNIYIEVVTTLEDKIDLQLKNLEYTLIILVPIVFFVALLIGYLIIKNLLKPVKNVIDEVQSISVEELDKRIKNIDSDDEIEELIDTFNAMLTRIENSFSKIKQFSNDASHELKTPLTVIRGELELALRKERSVSEYQNIMQSLLEETKQLQELIDNLLFLSQENENNLQEKFEEVELEEVIFDLIIDYQKIAKEKDINIISKDINPTTINANKTLLSIMIGNIINNSIKYSHQSSIIKIELKDNRLVIKDYGMGMDKKTLQSLFDRFYRDDNARTRGGYGLGLSIVKKIVQIYGFHIKVESELSQYSKFIITF